MSSTSQLVPPISIEIKSVFAGAWGARAGPHPRPPHERGAPSPRRAVLLAPGAPRAGPHPRPPHERGAPSPRRAVLLALCLLAPGRPGRVGRAVDELAVEVEGAHSGGGAAEQQVHRPVSDPFDRGGAAVRLDHQQRPPQPAGLEFGVEPLEVADDLRRQRGVDHRGRGPLVLAHDRGDVGGAGDPGALAEGGRDGVLMGGVAEAVEQGDGDRFHALRCEHR